MPIQPSQAREAKVEEPKIGKGDAAVAYSPADQALGKSVALSTKLFKDPSGKADYKSVKQGHLGDCAAIAAMTAVARIFPGRMNEIIKPAPGGVTVTLKHKDETVFVTKDLLVGADGAAYGHSSQDEMWVGALEKALAVSNGGKRYQGIEGGRNLSAREVIKRLTGDPGGMQPLTQMSKKDALALLSSAGNKPLVASTKAGCHSSHGTPGHAYTVLGTKEDPPGSGKHLVLLRNPWGEEHPSCQFNHGGGKIAMPLDEFMQSFEQVEGPGVEDGKQQLAAKKRSKKDEDDEKATMFNIGDKTRIGPKNAELKGPMKAHMDRMALENPAADPLALDLQAQLMGAQMMHGTAAPVGLGRQVAEVEAPGANEPSQGEVEGICEVGPDNPIFRHNLWG